LTKGHYLYIILIDTKKHVLENYMRYTEFYRFFNDRLVFSLDEIRQREPSFDKSRLYEWVRKAYIHRLIKPYYYFEGAGFGEPQLFKAANTVYRPSYISLESALSYHGLIPEKPLSVTSVSTRKTASFETRLGRLVFRRVATRLFFGYYPESGGFLVAEPEKALLDMFYLNPAAADRDTIEAMRLDPGALREKVDRLKLMSYADRTGVMRVKRAAKILGGML